MKENMNRLWLVLLFALTCFAQQVSVLATLPDITGTGAAVALTPGTHTYARWIQISCPVGNAGVVYWGDSNVSASRGASISAGGGKFIPYGVNDLSTIYVFATTGDIVKVTYQVY